MRLKARMAAVLTVAMVGVLLPPSASSVAGGDNQCWTYRPSEKKFARKMNRARTLRLIRKMKLDPELSKVARVHTRDMIRRGSIYHQSSSQLGRRVVSWTMLGENVGVGSTVDSLHRAFMNSPAHAANILRTNFNHMGVGARKKNGRLWVTVVFQSVNNPGTTLRMPRC